MSKNINRRSLKKRINRMVSAINFYSLFVMLIAMIISLGLLFEFCSKVISRNAATQMNLHISDMIRNKTQSNDFSVNSKENIDLFKSLGYSYIIFANEEQNSNLNTNKEINKNFSMPKNMPALMVKYRILINDKVIYNSLSPNKMFEDPIGPLENTRLMNFLNPSETYTVRDESDNEILKLEVKLNPFCIMIGYSSLIIVCFLTFLITWMISKFIIKISSKTLIKPLTILDTKMKEVVEGNLEEAMNTEIIFKKPIVEVQNIADYTNIILARMNEYVKTLANQNAELEAQNIVLQENADELEKINKKIDSKNLKMNNILNNVEQGLISFNEDLLIHGEYSLECLNLFGTELENQKLSSIIFNDNSSMANFLDELFVKIFNSNLIDRELYFPLLPEEIKFNEHDLTMAYKMVEGQDEKNVMLVIITDITEKRKLENKMDLESNILKMVVKAIINRDEFVALVNEYFDFTKQDFNTNSEDKKDKILREIHTFKGNFSQFEMVNLVKQLENLENKLYDEKLKYRINDIESNELVKYLQVDLDTIEKYAGKDFIKKGEFFYIEIEKFKSIERDIQKILPKNESKAVLHLIRRLREKSIREMLKTYPDYVMKLSERLGKSIRPFTITGDDVMLDNNYYGDIVKALVHVFRNAVDHGIETEDERLEKGKEIVGTITCNVEDCNDKFIIRISDDGNGINIEEVKKELLEKNIYSEEELQNLRDSDIMKSIFEQGVSTKEKQNTVSGRGVGMSAIKNTVDNYNGDINVYSEKGKGTTIEIILNKYHEEQENIDLEKFMEGVLEASKEILYKHLGEKFENDEISFNKHIFLNGMTALVSLKGTFNLIFMLSANRELAEKLVKGYMIETVDENDIINYIEDVIAEISNTILGNAFGKFDNTGNVFHIGIPAVLSHSEAYIKYTQSQIISCSLKNGNNELNINMLLVEEVQSENDSKEEY